MKSKLATWLAFGCGILWILVGLRDIFAPRFLIMSPRVRTGADVIVELATGAIFLFVAASFYMSKPKG